MTWASKRKLIISGVLAVTLLIATGGVGYFFFHTAPSCIDEKQNQDEEGIDCGGSCTFLCTASQAAPSTRFSVAFSPLPGRTDVIAYVDNPNRTAAAKQAPYTIELYDDQNVLITQTHGVADLPAGTTEPIFVPHIFSGSGVVSHVFLTFSETEIKWTHATPPVKTVEAQNIVYTSGDTPRVTAEIHNVTPKTKKGVQFVATLFGTDGKALAASATILDTLPAQGTNTIVFTWPSIISEPVARVDIIPVLLLSQYE